MKRLLIHPIVAVIAMCATMVMSRMEDTFPQVFATRLLKQELVQWQEILAEMDLLDVDCTTRANSATDCRVLALMHSLQQVNYFRTFLPMVYDHNVTQAVVRRTPHSRKLETSLYSTIAGFDCYPDYNGMMAWIRDFVNNSPSHLHAELIDIGDSYLKTQNQDQGYDIYALRLSSATSNIHKRAPMMLLSGVHPRELTPPELVRQWLTRFLQPDNVDYQLILESTDIYWIPYVNPDGRILAETSQPYRRKNLNRQADGADLCWDEDYGVDLNRNFPFRWGLDTGSSRQPCFQTYRGAGPASEPETQAVVDFAKSIFPTEQRRQESDYSPNDPPPFNEWTATGIFLDLHSYGNYYIYPWGFENTPSSNHEGLTAMARKLSSFTDYAVRGPGIYYTDPASGATDDWAYAILGAAGMTWELGDAFDQDCYTFRTDILSKNLLALTYAARLAHRPYSLSKGPDITKLEASSTELKPHDTLQITFEASDSAMTSSSTASHAVDMIRVYVDEHPYASDFPFPDWLMDSTQFTAEGKGNFFWNWQSLENYWKLSNKPIHGKHTFYFVAVDTEGYDGPVAAVRVDVDVPPTEAPSNTPTKGPTIAPTIATQNPTTMEPTGTTNQPSVQHGLIESENPTGNVGDGDDSDDGQNGSGSQVASQPHLWFTTALLSALLPPLL